MSLILLAFTSATAVAQSSTSNVASVKKGLEDKKRWSLRVDSTISRDLLKTSDTQHSASTQNSLKFGYVTGFGSISAKTSFSKELTNEREAYMGDSSFSFSRNVASPTKGIVSFGSLSFKIPTSEGSKDYAKLRTGVSLSEGISISDEILPLKNFSILTILGATKNFHEFKTSLTGRSNTSYSLSGVAYLTYSATDKLYFNLGGTYMKGWTYENNTKDLYSFSQAVGYSFTSAFNLEVGHEFGGSPLSPNGRKTEIEFFDERDSSVYASLTIKI